MIIKSDYRIPSVVDGYGVLLRNKHLNDAEHRLPEKTVLFVHGATYGSSLTYDYEIDGRSWMDAMASEGFDTWCLDLLGYGGSDRPREMEEPAGNHPPLTDTDHAVAEVDRAVDYILKDRGIEQLSLIGYSWGSAICGRYSGEYPGKVNQLVLYGALWLNPGAEARSINPDGKGPGAYRTVDADGMMSRWAIGLSDNEINQIVDQDVRREWCEAVIACDPTGSETSLLRAPTGVLKDFMNFSAAGKPWYDPGKINCPVQVVVGEHDRETTPTQGRQVFDLLPSEIDKRYTVIGGGTHSLLLEKNRDVLFSVVSGFLR